MKTVQNYFKKLKRNPTDAEIETIAQTWSEHCKHKTLCGIVDYVQVSGGKKTARKYNNLLKETIFKSATELKKKWCLSIFKDNAGIIDFDDKNALAFKVETHNHPCALEPYGGSATGIGGVIRDILGAGLGAKPIANTDIFCFGKPDTPSKTVPPNIHHPKRIMRGVVSGIRDYGNRMGIPTVNGAVYFDDGYIANPLVYCGSLGIIPKDKIEKKVSSGDLVLLIGGATGRDGMRGAAFSSVALDQEASTAAVQIGNPIVEKKVLDALLKARDMKLYAAITDCGAGGLSSAVGELGAETGVRVDLDKAPLKYEGLAPWEIWISEAQERMVLAVPRKNKEKILKVFESENVSAVFIGEFTDTKRLVLAYKGGIVCDMDMHFIHEGLPKTSKSAYFEIKAQTKQKPIKATRAALEKSIKAVLSDYNVCSREWIIRQYDYEVQGQTIIKPLQGESIEVLAPGDAAVIFPYTLIKGVKKAAVLSNGFNPAYGTDPYKMAGSAIEEALRNAVCAGADIEKMAILDNFCWGDTDDPKTLGSLARAANACYDFSKAFGIPFISGKDSLHNQYIVGKKKYSIPPALLISAIGVIEDASQTITMPFKRAGNKVFLLGLTRNEMGGSIFARLNKIKGGIVPDIYPEESKPLMKKIHKAIKMGLIKACHDISEGGLAIAISEMAFGGEIGASIDIDKVKIVGKLTPAEILFSQSNGRFIVEIDPKDEEKLRAVLKDSDFSEIGKLGGSNLTFESRKNKILFNPPVKDLYSAWKTKLS